MKILILGGNGMLGHAFFNHWKRKYTVKTCVRESEEKYKIFKFFDTSNTFFNVDVIKNNNLEIAIKEFKPHVIVNCIGVTKQLINLKSDSDFLEVNSIFPNELAKICTKVNIKMINLSTDCIFSGKKGFYSESDKADPDDIYGETKLKGEISNNPNVLTIRKSTLGLEISKNHGLVEWFLRQKGNIYGYDRVIYSGIISSELAIIIEMMLLNYPKVSGIINIASTPISKYQILVKLKKTLNYSDINIIKDKSNVIDRSLNPEKFLKLTNYQILSWDIMIKKLSDEIILRKKLNK